MSAISSQEASDSSFVLKFIVTTLESLIPLSEESKSVLVLFAVNMTVAIQGDEAGDTFGFLKGE